MKAKLYARTSATPKTNLKGQAAQVLRELDRDRTPRLATDIDKAIQENDPFKTRQDTLRVTLYYLIIFKKQGLVAASAAPAAVADPADNIWPTDEEIAAHAATVEPVTE